MTPFLRYFVMLKKTTIVTILQIEVFVNLYATQCSARAGGYYRSNLCHNQLVTRLGCPMGLSKTAITTSPSATRHPALSHCQRQLGLTGTTRACYSTYHAGHTIREQRRRDSAGRFSTRLCSMQGVVTVHTPKY